MTPICLEPTSVGESNRASFGDAGPVLVVCLRVANCRKGMQCHTNTSYNRYFMLLCLSDF